MNSGELSVMSWNVRSLNDAAHRELVKDTTSCVRPAVICLQETKISSMTSTVLLESVGYRLSSYHTLDAIGTRGGVLLGWDKDVVSLTDIECRLFTISATVRVLMSNNSFKITTCYGPADDGRKEEFLGVMMMLKPVTGTAWLITGDFNLIYQASDKNNLNLNRRLMGKFRAAIAECELLEVCLHNRRFTWSNERENPTMVKLDRAFCNSEWELLFPNFALNAVSAGTSDHCPIVLMCQDKVPRKASFKFEAHWLHVQGFRETVQLAWNKEHRGPALSVLRAKLDDTAKALRAWSKPLFSNVRLQLHIALEVIMRLDTAQEGRQLSGDEQVLK